jgi:hypothetical protein
LALKPLATSGTDTKTDGGFIVDRGEEHRCHPEDDAVAQASPAEMIEAAERDLAESLEALFRDLSTPGSNAADEFTGPAEAGSPDRSDPDDTGSQTADGRGSPDQLDPEASTR